MSIDSEHITETVKAKVMEACKKVNIKKKGKKEEQEDEDEDMSDEELQSMAQDCYEILDSDEEGAKQVVQIVEKAGGKASKTSKASTSKKVDPEKKKEVSKANNDLAKNVRKIQKLMNDGLKSASKATKSARCTEALKKEFSAAKQMQRDCNKFLAKLPDNNKAAKEMTFAHDVDTAKDLAKQLESRKKAVEQLEQIMQGMDEDEMEQAFNQCREAKKRIKSAEDMD